MCPGNRGTRHKNPDGRVSVSARFFSCLLPLFSFLFSPAACLASNRVLVIKRLMSLSSMARLTGTYSSTTVYRFVHVSIDTTTTYTDVVGGVHGIRADQAILSRPWGVLKARTLPAILISVLREGRSHGLRQYPETMPWQNPRQPANQYEQDDCISPIRPRMRATSRKTDWPRLSPMHPRPNLADPFAGMPVVSLVAG